MNEVNIIQQLMKCDRVGEEVVIEGCIRVRVDICTWAWRGEFCVSIEKAGIDCGVM